MSRAGLHSVEVEFDQAVTSTGNMATPAILVNGNAPNASSQVDPVTIGLTFAGLVGAVGSPWAISGQPSWVAEPISFPASGVTA